MNKDIPKIKTAKALKDYKLELTFEDGVFGTVDLSKYKGKGIFEFWNDYKKFENFRIINNYVTWNDDLDFDTLNFYLTITNKSFEEYANC